MSFRFFAERVGFGRSINLHMAGEVLSTGKRVVARPVVLETLEEDVSSPPMLQLTTDSCQSLMDELWNVGLRPTQGKQSEGQMGATERHLQDMRAIAFTKLQVQKP